ncbi:PD-(D/E)XK nuclease superfamily protein [Lentzea waywayandensis]|uniref:PD-(D/E)XK nuclease superfamily protein n=1 Tax=Lentzea waywayandensis TaxID=84724 RepID=A0A1I6D8Z9_9PSEU|nr:PD-(D/E)XK nuclease superfamily protein [Lentzea waywayandensis]
MTKPIRHLVPLGAENKWSDLVATLIELDPDPVADLLGLGDSPAHVSVEREVPAGSGGRVDLVISVDNEKRCVAEAKVLSGLGLGQLRRYRDHFPDVPHHVLITLEHFPIDVPSSAGWRSVRWEDLLRALSGSSVPLVAETASTWLSYVDGEMPVGGQFELPAGGQLVGSCSLRRSMMSSVSCRRMLTSLIVRAGPDSWRLASPVVPYRLSQLTPAKRWFVGLWSCLRSSGRPSGPCGRVA